MEKIKFMNPWLLKQKEEGYITIGTAPDGAPWIMRIRPPQKGQDFLRQAAYELGVKGGNDDYSGTPLHEVVLALDKLIKNYYSHRIRTEKGHSFQSTVLPKSVHSLIGESLLKRIMYCDTTVTHPASKDSHIETNTAACASAEAEEADLVIFQPGIPCMAFPDDGTSPVVVYMTHDSSGWPEFSYRRQFLEENVLGLSGCEFTPYNQPWNIPEQKPLKSIKDYLNMRKYYLQENYDVQWSLKFPRRSVAKKILELAQSLHRMHASGEIHGDMKPGNVIIDAKKVHAIDSLGLREGMRSPALTRGWAAPEQILATDLTPHTDQYPIGLMLLGITQGVLFGEETTVVVPSGGTNITRHTLFRNPLVYIDPEKAAVKKDKVRSWQKFIGQCLRFKQTERFPKMSDLIGELERLINEDSLIGNCSFHLNFGNPVIAAGLEGVEQFCWLIRS